LLLEDSLQHRLLINQFKKFILINTIQFFILLVQFQSEYWFIIVPRFSLRRKKGIHPNETQQNVRAESIVGTANGKSSWSLQLVAFIVVKTFFYFKSLKTLRFHIVSTSYILYVKPTDW